MKPTDSEFGKPATTEDVESSPQQTGIPIARPFFDGSELETIEQVLSSGWVTQGPAVAEFENLLASYVNADFAVATSNCTAAMHLAWKASGIGKGHEVLCPSYSFIASANAIRHSGAEPWFVDISQDTLNIDVDRVRASIEEDFDRDLKNRRTGARLKAILLVHQVGIPCDIDAFQELAGEYGLVIVEDAACAFGSAYKNQRIGGSGNACAFSFYPRKVITTGEGGLLCCASEELAKKVRVLRAHGMSLTDMERHNLSSTTFESYEVVGFNYRMTDIQAALGLSQMKLLDGILKRRQEIARRYDRAFSQIEGMRLPKLPEYVSFWNRQSYPLQLDAAGSTERNRLMEHLQREGIATRRGIPPIHQEPVYKRELTLPVSEQVSQNSLFLPIYPQLTDGQVNRIIEAVRAGYCRL